MNGKYEWQMTKESQNPNDQIRSSGAQDQRAPADSDFGLLSSFVIRHSSFLRVGLYLALALGTFLCYWPLTHHDFIVFDDHEYILDNTHVTSGLTPAGVAWAFGTGYAANWHPITWISHMLDCSLFHLNPGGHHLTNLLFRTANVLLLFLLLRQMTGSFWRSACVSALFAWHPFHVESVAWASERKDVLSAFFFLLTLLAYVAYTQSKAQTPESKVQTGCEPDGQNSGVTRHALVAPKSDEGGSRITHHASRYYALTLFLFALCLMSKPMLVTLPFVLFLLDFWPLQRVRFSSAQEGSEFDVQSSKFKVQSFLLLIREKIPLLALSFAASLVTFFVQRAGGAVSSLQTISLRLRLENTVVAYAKYIFKTIWPVNLSSVYPYSKHLPLLWIIGSALLLIGLSALFVSLFKRRGYLVVGWLWFVGMLVPTIGLVQVGPQAMADRYMYLPSIGLFILIVWGIGDLVASMDRGMSQRTSLVPHTGRSTLLTLLTLATLLAFASCTRCQLSYWQNSVILFSHDIQVTKDNYVAYGVLGTAFFGEGKFEEALPYYREALRLSPKHPEANYDLGTALLKTERFDDAITCFNRALELKPTFAHAQNNLGKALLKLGRFDEALAHLARAVALTPNDPEAHYNVGTVLVMQGHLDQAVVSFSKALTLKPDYWQAHSNLGITLMRQGNTRQGTAHLYEACRLNSGDPESYSNLGMALLDANHPAEAAKQLSAGLKLKPDDQRMQSRLAQALAQSNQAH